MNKIDYYVSLYEAAHPGVPGLFVNRRFVIESVKPNIDRFEKITWEKFNKAKNKPSRETFKELLDWIIKNFDIDYHDRIKSPFLKMILNYIYPPFFYNRTRRKSPPLIQNFETVTKKLYSYLYYEYKDDDIDFKTDVQIQEQLKLIEQHFKAFFKILSKMYKFALTAKFSADIDILNYNGHKIEVHLTDQGSEKYLKQYLNIIEKCTEAVVKEGLASALKTIKTILVPTSELLKSHYSGSGNSSAYAFYSNWQNAIYMSYDKKPDIEYDIFVWFHELGHHLHLTTKVKVQQEILNRLDKEYELAYKKSIKNDNVYPRKYSQVNYKEWFADLFGLFMCSRHFGIRPDILKAVSPEAKEMLRKYLRIKYDISFMAENEQNNKSSDI